MLELLRLAELSNGAVDQATALVTARVDILCDFESHILIPDIENLERDEQRIAAEIGQVAAMLAKAQSLERTAKRNLKKHRAARFVEILREVNTARSVSDKPGREPGSEKINSLIDTEGSTEELEEILEHATETAEFLKAYLKALEVKASLLPGMQGSRNAMSRI